uniref:Uncharacterized protein n=1 Tax=Tetranychus urticae TaxID=32264 RepID=T1KLY1_TETUR
MLSAAQSVEAPTDQSTPIPTPIPTTVVDTLNYLQRMQNVSQRKISTDGDTDSEEEPTTMSLAEQLQQAITDLQSVSNKIQEEFANVNDRLTTCERILHALNKANQVPVEIPSEIPTDQPPNQQSEQDQADKKKKFTWRGDKSESPGKKKKKVKAYFVCPLEGCNFVENSEEMTLHTTSYHKMLASQATMRTITLTPTEKQQRLQKWVQKETERQNQLTKGATA